MDPRALQNFPCFGNPAIPGGPVPARRSAPKGSRHFGMQALPRAELHFACLREAASAKAGHAGVAFRPTIARGLALSAAYFL